MRTRMKCLDWGEGMESAELLFWDLGFPNWVGGAMSSISQCSADGSGRGGLFSLSHLSRHCPSVYGGSRGYLHECRSTVEPPSPISTVQRPQERRRPGWPAGRGCGGDVKDREGVEVTEGRYLGEGLIVPWLIGSFCLEGGRSMASSERRRGPMTLRECGNMWRGRSISWLLCYVRCIYQHATIRKSRKTEATSAHALAI